MRSSRRTQSDAAYRTRRRRATGRVGVNPDVVVPGAGRCHGDELIFQKANGCWLIDFGYDGPNRDSGA